MTTPLPYPATVLQPFANTGSKNTIPNTPSVTPGLASMDIGFPPLTMTRIQDGGVPPSGLDFNGIYNLLSQHDAWVAAGGMYVFNSALATFTGGYKKGATVQSNDNLSVYISLVDNNTIDFNSTPSSIGVQWAAYAGAAASNSVTAISTTGGTTTLTTTQAVSSIINVTGVLASAATIVFPAIVRSWRIINGTTGAFGMVAKAPSGQSLTCTQGKTNTVFYDGTQLQFPDWDTNLDSPALRGVPTAPTAAALNSTTQLATTAFVTAADTALLNNTALTGNPTAPTQAPLTNNTRLATTAYADAAAAAVVTTVTAVYINSNFSAGTTGDLWTDTSAGGFTVTLPDPPVGKNILTFRDIFGTWNVNNLTINPGTKTVLGVAGNLVANAAGRNFGMWYDTANTTWKLI